MTALESDVLGVLRQPRRLLYPETIAAILQQSRPDIDQAVKSLQSQRLAWRNRAGQWSARR